MFRTKPLCLLSCILRAEGTLQGFSKSAGLQQKRRTLGYFCAHQIIFFLLVFKLAGAWKEIFLDVQFPGLVSHLPSLDSPGSAVSNPVL